MNVQKIREKEKAENAQDIIDSGNDEVLETWTSDKNEVL